LKRFFSLAGKSFIEYCPMTIFNDKKMSKKVIKNLDTYLLVFRILRAVSIYVEGGCVLEKKYYL
jgi:hypothetical protein